MATISFDLTKFRAMYPAFSNATTYPEPVLQLYWDNATSYISDQTGGCFLLGMTLAQQTLALYLMTAHLAYLATQIMNGGSSQNTGLMSSATIDKISVSMFEPPKNNQWQFWLNQSPYGQQLLALLQVATSGGAYYGGYPSACTLRR